jgi:type II secretory ATPase GspE/PulE/Tfp pilus assembly ATPase PilB-like protein
MVLRLIYEDGINLYDLGFNQQQVNLIDSLKKIPTGICLISGPTGAGKSTTLEVILKQISIDNGLDVNNHLSSKLNIITIEDPPEYPILGAVQIPVLSDEGVIESRPEQFRSAIKASLRLDPDVIMISEVRDIHSAHLAVEASATGHQVWTTIHANSSFAIVERLYQLGVNHFDLFHQGCVSGLLSQALVRKLCGICSMNLVDYLDEISVDALNRLKVIFNDDLTGIKLRNKEGCQACNLGAKGRTVIAEVVALDQTLITYLMRRSYSEAHNYWLQKGGLPLMAHALQKIKQGLVDPMDAEKQVGVLTQVNSQFNYL